MGLRQFNILEQIANPVIADMPGAIEKGRQYNDVQQKRDSRDQMMGALPQNGTPEQNALAVQSVQNPQAAKVYQEMAEKVGEENLQEIAMAVFAAHSLPEKEGKAVLKKVRDRAEKHPAMQAAIDAQLVATGKDYLVMSDKAFQVMQKSGAYDKNRMVDAAQMNAGSARLNALTSAATPRKTAGQLERDVVVDEQNATTAELNATTNAGIARPTADQIQAKIDNDATKASASMIKAVADKNTPRKTAEQLQQEIDIKQQGADTADKNLQQRIKEYSKPPAAASTTLKKHLNEKAELIASGVPKDDPMIEAYDNKIFGEKVDLNMSQDEIDFWGAQLYTTGKMPSLGRSKEASQLRAAIARSSARLGLAKGEESLGADKNVSPVEAAMNALMFKSDTKAIQASMTFLDKQLSSMTSFVTNLNSQVDKVGELSKDLKTFDATLLNVPLRTLRGKIQGSALQAKYDLYLAEISREIAKLASGSTQSVGMLSDSDREHWDTIHNPRLSVEKMLELLEETKEAANFRIESVTGALDLTRKRMRNRDFASEQKTAPSGNGMVEGRTATGPNGEKLVVRDGKLVPVNGAK